MTHTIFLCKVKKKIFAMTKKQSPVKEMSIRQKINCLTKPDGISQITILKCAIFMVKKYPEYKEFYSGSGQNPWKNLATDSFREFIGNRASLNDFKYFRIFMSTMKRLSDQFSKENLPKRDARLEAKMKAEYGDIPYSLTIPKGQENGFTDTALVEQINAYNLNSDSYY